MANRPATDPTIRNIGTTPVLFFPVPTAWPMSTGCNKNIYRQNNGGSILAWDPIYPQIAASALTERRQSCFPTQQQSWHFQDLNATPSTALGPAFVCPESYSAVAATVLESNSASRTEFTYCCPPYVPSSPHVAAYSHTIHELTPPPENTPSTPSPPQTHAPPSNGITSLPPNPPNPSTNPPRSTSLLPVGSTLSFVSVTFTPTIIAPATTTTTVLAYIQSSTVVTATAETVYAVPINGYNIIDAAAAAAAAPEGPPDNNRSSSTPTGAGGLPSNNTPTSTSPGTIAGAVVGGLVALALAVALAYFVGRRRSSRRRSMVLRGYGDARAAELAGAGAAPAEAGAYIRQQQQLRGWDDDKDSPYDRYGVAPAHELPSQIQRYEMPVQGQRYELHGGWAAEVGEKGGQGGGYHRSG